MNRRDLRQKSLYYGPVQPVSAMAESAKAAFVRRAYELVNAGDLETLVEA